jgi:hypothetical protein
MSAKMTIIIASAIMTAVITGACSLLPVEEEAPPPPLLRSYEKTEYKFAEVTKGDITDSRRISCQYSPAVEESLSFGVSGVLIESVYVSNGDKVKKGQVIVDNIPAPVVSDDGVLVKVLYSCISAGTEIVGVNQSGKSIIKKAIEQPEKVKKALNLVKSQGIGVVLDKVKEMDIGKPTGYSAAGVVITVGKNVLDLKEGDKVACAGAGFANHAEYIDVPRNLLQRFLIIYHLNLLQL